MHALYRLNISDVSRVSRSYFEHEAVSTPSIMVPLLCAPVTPSNYDFFVFVRSSSEAPFHSSNSLGRYQVRYAGADCPQLTLPGFVIEKTASENSQLCVWLSSERRDVSTHGWLFLLKRRGFQYRGMIVFLPGFAKISGDNWLQMIYVIF